MRTKVVYAWAHLFAFRARACWGGCCCGADRGAEGLASRRLRLVKRLLGLAAHGAGARRRRLRRAHEPPVGLAPWPPLALVYATAAACVLRPLGTTVYTRAR